jgi:tryptophan synthase alpha chain
MTCSRFLQLPEKGALSVFFTAGYPRLNDTCVVLDALQQSGVDMVEVGFPFSDPVADGPTIQESNLAALQNGMTVATLMTQLKEIRGQGITMPILLMGYLNPVERYGAERFFREAAECGADALILPDMPFDGYQDRYKALFAKYRLNPVFLVTSRTEPERVRAFDAEGPAFLYVLSSDAVTGGSANITGEREAFFERLSAMGLRSRLIVGFGVSDRASFQAVTKHTSGAIVGSAFLRAISHVPRGSSESQSDGAAMREAVKEFVSKMR